MSKAIIKELFDRLEDKTNKHQQLLNSLRKNQEERLAQGRVHVNLQAKHRSLLEDMETLKQRSHLDDETVADLTDELKEERRKTTNSDALQEAHVKALIAYSQRSWSGDIMSDKDRAIQEVQSILGCNAGYAAEVVNSVWVQVPSNQSASKPQGHGPEGDEHPDDIR